MDALRRHHQCATIQLDFQLPIRFDLKYSAQDGSSDKKPVIIHRAILGSVERMIAILTESFGGKWPFWLSPRQCSVVPVAPPFEEYALKVRQTIHEAGFVCDYDYDNGNTMNKKIRTAQVDQYNFILVVGEKEQENGTVNVRTRDNKVHGEFSVADVVERFKKLQDSKTNNSEEF
jgi:threonyl-tRNA synthetase